MDDLLREFLTETSESLDTVDNQLVRFEQDPNNAKILDNIFRLVQTIKRTCGLLGLAGLAAAAGPAQGGLLAQSLERPLRPGEVSLDELERAFRETATEAAPQPPKQAAAPPV